MKQKIVIHLIEDKNAFNLTQQLNEFTSDKGTSIISIKIIYSKEFLAYKAFISYWVEIL
jgi:hypothetical protein